MSFLTWLENTVTTTEHDIQMIVADIVKGVQVFESDLQKVVDWAVKAAPTVTASLGTITSVLATVGFPAAAPEIMAANEAIAAINAFASAYKNGAGDVNSALAAYSVVKTGQAAAANAAASLAKMPAASAAASVARAA